MSDSFLLCRDCWVVHPIHAACGPNAGDALSEESAIAYGEFLAQHRHHPLERVHRTSQRDHYEGALWDPMRARFIEVGNGDDVYTIRSSRDAIEEPRLHAVIDQRIHVVGVRLTVEEALVRRALDYHFYPYALRPTKTEYFIRALREVVDMLSGDDIETAFDDGDDPAVGIGRLPDEGCVALLERCLDIFDAWELPRLASFVSANRDEYGALALRVTRESAVH